MNTPKNEDNIQINEMVKKNEEITKGYSGNKGVLGKSLNMIQLIEEESRNLETDTLNIPNRQTDHSYVIPSQNQTVTRES